MGVVEMLINEGRAEGRAEGRVEGRVEGQKAERHKIVKKLITQSTMSIADIAEVCGVSEYFVRQAKREIKTTP